MPDNKDPEKVGFGPLVWLSIASAAALIGRFALELIQYLRANGVRKPKD